MRQLHPILVLSFLFFSFFSSVNAQKVVRKVACTEYWDAYLYSDSTVRALIFNLETNQNEFDPLPINGRKAVDVSTGFNVVTILDDSGYVWLNQGDPFNPGSTRWDTDATGAPFNGNKTIYGYFYTYLSIRNDGSIWYWGGDDYQFYSSNGTSIDHPVRLHTPPGVQFTKLAPGNTLLALATNGDVYAWSTGDSNYVKVTLPGPASDIAAGSLDFNIAVVPTAGSSSHMGWPYGFGDENLYYGASSAGTLSAPIPLKTVWNMTSPIKEIIASSNVIQYIDSLGNLYGIGDNAQGEIGNGQELVNHAEQYLSPYGWSWAKYGLMTPAPVHVASGIKFKKLSSGPSYAFYHYALDEHDSLYFWGRNKSFVGGDGAYDNNEADYPNAMDILTPSRRTPLALTPDSIVYYSFTPYTLTTPAQQTTSSSTASLTATATPSLLTAAGHANYGYTIVKYHWTQLSGPSATITHPDSLNTTVTGLTNGTYVFTIQTTDNNTATISANDTIVASGVATGNVVRKVACTEYRDAYLYSDSTARALVWNPAANQNEFAPLPINGRKAVDIATSGFKLLTILDDSGYVWLNQDNTTSTRWDTDTTGAPFNGNTKIYGYFFTYLSIRNDGSIWYWGGDDYHFYSSSGTNINRPVRLHAPSGVQFTKLAPGNTLLALASNGDVYAWSMGDSNYVKVTLPRPASDIAAGHLDFNIVVVPDAGSTSNMGWPYGFGVENLYYGASSAGTMSAPIALRTVWAMTSPIKEITASDNVIHYIDSLGNLYGIGDNAVGEIGNGQELVNHAELYATPYGWSWNKYGLMTPAPVHVSTGTKFKKLFTGISFAFYHYALDEHDSLYFWGRNKSFVGGDGAYNNNEADYPNALDILTPSLRTPLRLTPDSVVYYNFTPYTLTPPAKQTIHTSATSLTATATPSLLTAAGHANYGYTIVRYHWTQLSGPSATITHPDSLNTTVTGLSNGTYIFTIQTTDNNTGTISANDTVVVSGLSSSPGRLSADANASAMMQNKPLVLYPNPVQAQQLLTLEGELPEAGQVRLQVYDMNGRLVRQEVAEAPTGYLSTTIPTSGLTRGTYQLTVLSGGGKNLKTWIFVIQ